MNRRKLLSLLLVLVTVVSMVATLGVSVNAENADNALTVGKSTVYTLEGKTLVAVQQFNAASGSVNNVTIASSWAEYLRIDDVKQNGDNIDITITPLKAMSKETVDNLYLDDKVVINYSVKGESFIWDPGHESVWFDEIKAGNSFYLDLDEEDSTYPKSKTIDQLYSATVTENKTDVTKVQVSWKLENITASVINNKIWDTETLKWIDDVNNENSATADPVTAEFDFVNLSSVKIDAKVSFEVESGFSAVTPAFSDNDVTDGDGIITLGTKADGKDTDNEGKIEVEITPDADDFKTITADVESGVYGTYTVTISATKAVTANYLTFTAEAADSSVTPKFNAGSYQYSVSTDGGTTWTDWTDGDNDGTQIDLANIGDQVRLKGTDCVSAADLGADAKSFEMSGKVAAGGDVTCLINGVGGDVALTTHCCYYMFSYCTALTSAPNLPSTTLAEGCYHGMFEGCTSLTAAPALPATVMQKDCYMAMFNGCEKLAEAPELPATELADNCYNAMFKACTSLFVAPSLPATELKDSCYLLMFEESSIIQIPEFPDNLSLADNCFSSMFYHCKYLRIQIDGDMPENGGKIFEYKNTYPEENADISLYSKNKYAANMFVGVQNVSEETMDGLNPNATPTKGHTYYWAPAELYKLTINCVNCTITDPETLPIVIAPNESIFIIFEKTSDYSFPAYFPTGMSKADVEIDGCSAELQPVAMGFSFNPNKEKLYLHDFTGDVTITIVCTENE